MYTTLSTRKYETHIRIVSCLPNCFSYFTLNIDNGQHNAYKRNSDKILYKNTKDYKQTLDIIHDSIVISVQYEGFNRAFLPNYGHDFKISIWNSRKGVISQQVIRYFTNRFDSAKEINTAKNYGDEYIIKV